MNDNEETLQDRNRNYQRHLDLMLENMFLGKLDDSYEPLREKVKDLEFVLHEKERSGGLCAEIFWGSNNAFKLHFEPNVIFLYWESYLKSMHKDDFTDKRKEEIKQRAYNWGADICLVEYLGFKFDEIKNFKE